MAYRTPPHVQEQKDLRRRQILDAAASLFSSHGYHETSIRDVVEAAGISIGSFYFYFASKDDLFDALFAEMSEAFLSVMTDASDATRTDPAGGTAEAIARAMSLIASNRPLSRFLLLESGAGTTLFEVRRKANEQRFMTLVHNFLDEMQERNQIHVTDTASAACSLMGGLYFSILSWLSEPQGNDLPFRILHTCLYHLKSLGLTADPDAIAARIETVLAREPSACDCRPA